MHTYILNVSPYTIDYFMNMNKSYIGGNMESEWKELIRENIYPKYINFNGGLSLRKRLDMIEIINTFRAAYFHDLGSYIPENVC